LGYSRQGYSIIMPSNQGVLTGTTQKVQVNTYLNYIMLSVVPRFYPGIDRQFCLFVGPSFSWLASAERQVSRFIDGKKEGDTKKLDLLGDEWPKEAQPKRLDVGILLGLDYEFGTGIILGFEGNVGMKNTLKKQKNDSNSYIKNLSVSITLGYNFAKLFTRNK
jgi:hypothetical protein